MSDEVAMMRVILRCSPDVMMNTQILTAPDAVYFVSAVDGLRQVSPQTPTHPHLGENCTVSRVSAGETLLDAIQLNEMSTLNALKGNRLWMADRFIYKVPCAVSLSVNDKLSPHAAHCRERWLLPYQHASQDYPTIPVGRFFYQQPKKVDTLNKGVYMYVHISTAVPVELTRRLTLPEGYYALHVDETETVIREVNAITQEQYLNAKQGKFGHVDTRPPAFLRWE